MRMTATVVIAVCGLVGCSHGSDGSTDPGVPVLDVPSNSNFDNDGSDIVGMSPPDCTPRFIDLHKVVKRDGGDFPGIMRILEAWRSESAYCADVTDQEFEKAAEASATPELCAAVADMDHGWMFHTNEPPKPVVDAALKIWVKGTHGGPVGVAETNDQGEWVLATDQFETTPFSRYDRAEYALSKIAYSYCPGGQYHVGD